MFPLPSFVREEGKSEIVFCIHAVPSSSFLYRKSELANRGYKGVALDLPGLGLSDRPQAFDYVGLV
jgi:pimeloyl-ACP methyl ester carboxylesterase